MTKQTRVTRGSRTILLVPPVHIVYFQSDFMFRCVSNPWRAALTPRGAQKGEEEEASYVPFHQLFCDRRLVRPNRAYSPWYRRWRDFRTQQFSNWALGRIYCERRILEDTATACRSLPAAATVAAAAAADGDRSVDGDAVWARPQKTQRQTLLLDYGNGFEFHREQTLVV